MISYIINGGKLINPIVRVCIPFIGISYFPGGKTILNFSEVEIDPGTYEMGWIFWPVKDDPPWKWANRIQKEISFEATTVFFWVRSGGFGEGNI